MTEGIATMFCVSDTLYIIDLRVPIPPKFNMDGALWRWSLMIQKWFTHEGSIALDKFTVSLEDSDVYNKERHQFSEEFSARSFTTTNLWLSWGCAHIRRRLKVQTPAYPKTIQQGREKDTIDSLARQQVALG